MSWTPLTPLKRSAAIHRATASIQALKHGGFKLTLFLTQMLHEEIGAPDRCEAMAGAGELEGQVRLVVKPDGDFVFSKGIGGSRRISLPHFVGLPQAAFGSAPCRIVHQASGELVLALPVQAWRSPVSGAPSVKPPPPQPVTGKVDLAEDLARFGFTATPRPGDRFCIDGEVHPRARALIKLNLARRRAGEAALLAEEVV